MWPGTTRSPVAFSALLFIFQGRSSTLLTLLVSDPPNKLIVLKDDDQEV